MNLSASPDPQPLVMTTMHLDDFSFVKSKGEANRFEKEIPARPGKQSQYKDIFQKCSTVAL